MRYIPKHIKRDKKKLVLSGLKVIFIGFSGDLIGSVITVFTNVMTSCLRFLTPIDL
jgi:hypothetical protein